MSRFLSFLFNLKCANLLFGASLMLLLFAVSGNNTAWANHSGTESAFYEDVLSSIELPLTVNELADDKYGCYLTEPYQGTLHRWRMFLDVPTDAMGRWYQPYRASNQADHDHEDGYFSYMFCPRNATNDQGEIVSFVSFLRDNIDGASANLITLDHTSLSDPERLAVSVLNRILWMAAVLGVWVLRLAGYFLGVILGVSQFITNPLVTGGWPFIQGIANLGFILALLFIAASFTLRLNIGGDIKRLLPRLLIAALLINFSLVIGAVIIDSSRLVMAVMANTMTGSTDMHNVGAGILRASHLVQQSFDLTTLADESNLLGTVGLKAENTSWIMPLNVLQAAVLIWAVAIAVAIISFGLLFRYIALILLLIISPVAYLAYAFPGAKGVSDKWWANFLKFTLYGPIALFVLLLLVRLSDSAVNVLGDENNEVDYFAATLNTVLVISMCLAAAVAGKNLGGIGGNAAMNFASNSAKRTGGWIRRNPTKAGALMGAAATGGVGLWAVGGAAAGGAAGYAAYKGGLVRKGFADRRKAHIENKEKATRQHGAKVADYWYGSSKERKQIKEATKFKPKGATEAERAQKINDSNSPWNASTLGNEKIGGALSKEQRQEIMTNDKVNHSYKVALVKNPAAVQKMGAEETERIENLDVNLDVDLPTEGPNVGRQEAAENREKNKVNKAKNAANREIQKNYFETLNKINRKKEEENK